MCTASRSPLRSWGRRLGYSVAVMALIWIVPESRLAADVRLFHIVDLGLNGPSELNQRGQIAIEEQVLSSGAQYFQQSYAAIWEFGRVRALAAPPDHHPGRASGINDRGEAVGSASYSPFGPGYGCPSCPAFAHAYLWRSDGTRVQLPHLARGGDTDASASHAETVNGNGDIVGWSGYGVLGRGGWQKAVLWRRGVALMIGPSALRTSGAAQSINAAGEVVGWAELTPQTDWPGPRHAFLWDGMAMRDLGSLAGPVGTSTASDINDAGQVVGTSTIASGSQRAFLWQNGMMMALEPLAGDTDSAAVAINRHGDVVGISFRQSCTPACARAVIWERGVASDLNSRIAAGSGWTLREPRDIADDGAIVGAGVLNGGPRYFLLNPSTSAPPPPVLPGPPTTLVAAVSGSRVSLMWAPPVSGDPATRYIIEAGDVTGTLLAAIDTGNARTTFVQDRVMPGVYLVRVRAASAAGVGAPSGIVTVVVGR